MPFANLLVESFEIKWEGHTTKEMTYIPSKSKGRDSFGYYGELLHISILTP